MVQTQLASRSTARSPWTRSSRRCSSTVSVESLTVRLTRLCKLSWALTCIHTDVMDGYNGTVFAYGQTGSGKSHTMMVRASSP